MDRRRIRRVDTGIQTIQAKLQHATIKKANPLLKGLVIWHFSIFSQHCFEITLNKRITWPRPKKQWNHQHASCNASRSSVKVYKELQGTKYPPSKIQEFTGNLIQTIAAKTKGSFDPSRMYANMWHRLLLSKNLIAQLICQKPLQKWQMLQKNVTKRLAETWNSFSHVHLFHSTKILVFFQ